MQRSEGKSAKLLRARLLHSLRVLTGESEVRNSSLISPQIERFVSDNRVRIGEEENKITVKGEKGVRN